MNALLEGQADICIKNLNQNIIEWQKIHDEIVPPAPKVEEKKEEKPSALKLIAEKAKVSFAEPSSKENSARQMTESGGSLIDDSPKKAANDDSTPVNDDEENFEEDDEEDEENLEEIDEENNDG